MMGRMSTLGTLYLTIYCCCVLEVTWSLEANGSSSSPVSKRDTEYRQRASNKNNSKFTRGQLAGSLFPTRNDFPTGNFSQKKISPTKIRSVDQNNETFDGFEFVDSPEMPATIAVEKSNDGSINELSRIDKNLWKTDRNGTIIHDVHISLVHPANMVGINNESGPDGLAPTEFGHTSSDSNMRANTTREARSSPEPGVHHKYDENNTGISLKSMFMEGNSSAIANISDIYSVYGSTILPSSAVTNTSTSDVGLTIELESGNINTNLSAAGRMTSDGKFQPLINLGVSINAKGPCLSDCLTKCYTAESHAGDHAACLPSVPPLPHLVDFVKGKLESGSGFFHEEANEFTTPRVPILPLHEIGLLKVKNPGTEPRTEPKPGFLLEDVCLSKSCVLKAADVLSRMEKSADPCDSFYKFACGGYVKDEIPGLSPRSVFDHISSDILARMYSILKSPLLVNDHPPVKLLKKFYGKCILTSPELLYTDALKELGGWPSPYSLSQRAPQRLWGQIAFNQTYGTFFEYSLVSLNLTSSDEKDMWMLNVGYPWFVKEALNSNSLSVLDEIEDDLKKVASTLKIDDIITKSSLVDLRIFMASTIKLANATMSSDVEKGVYSLKDLKAKFIHLDVVKNLPFLLESIIAIDDNEMIHVSNMMYLRKVDDLLRDSTVRTQAAYLALTAVRSLAVLIGTATDNVIEKHCVELTAKLLPHLFYNLYFATFVSNSKVASATRIAFQIRDNLLYMLDEDASVTAVDKITDKVEKLMLIWSNRNEVICDLNGITRGFDENPSFLGFVKTGIWNLKKGTYAYLHQRANSSLESFIQQYSRYDYGGNAFYHSQRVLTPSLALHENIFDPDVPPYVSFGGLGLIFGHELFHSVIVAGDISNTANYKNMERCMISQFDKFTKKDSKDGMSSVLTKDENIADYGGFKVVYRAFMEWYNHSSKVSKEKRLPGLQNFNEKQMFWLTSATNWCQKVSPILVSRSVDRHAPPEYRVDGQLANIPDFALDFNCPENSPMNPKEKCSLW